MAGESATWRVETRAVHSGERVPLPAGVVPTATPIYNTATFVYDTAEALDAVFAGEAAGYVYSRVGNPTTRALETAVAALEGARHCTAFASGMAALHGALLAAGVANGDRVVVADDLYATTYSLLRSILEPLGVATAMVDVHEAGALESALTAAETRAVLVESISNPLLRVTDVPAVAAACRRHGAVLIVDATFAPPPLGAPLAQGADLVVHSATKYLGGHADVVAGVVYGSGMVAAGLAGVAGTLGSVLGPHDAWLLLRGLKTLPLRLRHQCASARWLANRLREMPGVARVHYPGLASHASHAVARLVLRPGWYGGMVAFQIAAAGTPEVLRFLNAVRLCLPTTSLGDVYTLVSCPALASHRDMDPAQRERLGIVPGLMRLSVGIEHPSDIVADLRAALAELEAPAVFTPAPYAMGKDEEGEEPAP